MTTNELVHHLARTVVHLDERVRAMPPTPPRPPTPFDNIQRHLRHIKWMLALTTVLLLLTIAVYAAILTRLP